VPFATEAAFHQKLDQSLAKRQNLKKMLTLVMIDVFMFSMVIFGRDVFTRKFYDVKN